MRIARAAARYHLGVCRGVPLTLAGVEMCRDWGHAKDYVQCMWKMLQQDSASDFVIATGKARSVKDFVVAAFAHVNVGLV